MKVLLLGGTRFIGYHVANTLFAAGHNVTTFTRGQSSDRLPPGIERLHGDRDKGAAGLRSVKNRKWEVCIDLSGYTPAQVRPSAELLRDSVEHYVFISAVSVYGDPTERPVLEPHPLLPPARDDVTEIDADTYGPLKVACENIVQGVYGNRCTLLRPQIVAGPEDDRNRYQYWAQRAMQAGPMAAPGDGSDHMQVIDVRDVAGFVRSVVENEINGVFNLAGPRFTWAELMKMLGTAKVVWVPAEVIQAAGVTEFELPLFRTERGPRSGLMDVSAEKAQAAGLTLTAPEETIAYIRRSSGRTFAPQLTSDREQELLRLALHRVPG